MDNIANCKQIELENSFANFKKTPEVDLKSSKEHKNQNSSKFYTHQVLSNTQYEDQVIRFLEIEIMSETHPQSIKNEKGSHFSNEDFRSKFMKYSNITEEDIILEDTIKAQNVQDDLLGGSIFHNKSSEYGPMDIYLHTGQFNTFSKLDIRNQLSEISITQRDQFEFTFKKEIEERTETKKLDPISEAFDEAGEDEDSMEDQIDEKMSKNDKNLIKQQHDNNKLAILKNRKSIEQQNLSEKNAENDNQIHKLIGKSHVKFLSFKHQNTTNYSNKIEPVSISEMNRNLLLSQNGISVKPVKSLTYVDLSFRTVRFINALSPAPSNVIFPSQLINFTDQIFITINREVGDKNVGRIKKSPNNKKIISTFRNVIFLDYDFAKKNQNTNMRIFKSQKTTQNPEIKPILVENQKFQKDSFEKSINQELATSVGPILINKTRKILHITLTHFSKHL